METFEAIMTRRSIRKYTEEKLTPEEIQSLLQAGMNAPSATNRRPIHLYVIENKEVLARLSHSNLFARMLKQAPLAIAIVADKRLQPVKDFQINDGSAAVENILLCAHSLGLGAVWLGVIHLQPWYKVLYEQLQLPEYMVPISLVAIGHPAETKTTEDRYDEKKIHFIR